MAGVAGQSAVDVPVLELVLVAGPASALSHNLPSSPLPAVVASGMLRKSVSKSVQRSRAFHSSAVARRVVGTNPVKAEEVKVRV